MTIEKGKSFSLAIQISTDSFEECFLKPAKESGPKIVSSPCSSFY